MHNILITGVSSGIGLATALFFIRKQEFKVFGTVRNELDGENASKILGQKFIPIVLDVCDMASIQIAFEMVSQMCPNGISLLINNAGIAVSGPIKEVNILDFEKQMDVNVNGVFRVTNIFLPLLGASLDSKITPGKIINISSVSGLFNAPFLGPYCISKHALESLSDIYRRELTIYGIKVIVIEPGPIKTEIWSKAKVDKDKYLNTDYSQIWKGMLKRIEKTESAAIDAEILAKKIYSVFKKNNPAPRYIVTKNKFSNWFSYYLIPNLVIDYMLKKALAKGIKRK